MSADVNGLRELAATLARSGAEAERQGRQVVSRGALNIKNDWRNNARATAGAHARLYPLSIGYDLHARPGGGTLAVIGPDKEGPQGPLGNILEYGTSTQAGHNDGGRALDAEEPRYFAAVEQLGTDLL
jgi:hypothetical protein